ncbi:hypothetical protein RJ640_004655 [Escallonia rubra]|uniref:Septum-promoting GTP-binding protein 1 n=1 Tax=Escallonia rubra TaxID=112253 RepID=A0AA88RLE6_9ASTE|nr:hypothetical protein RJ640_004655 [Escallonia rubra]
MREQEATIHFHGSRLREAAGKMTQLCRKVVHASIRWAVLQRVSIFRDFFSFIWERVVACSMGNRSRYRRLSTRPSSAPTVEDVEAGHGEPIATCSGCDTDSDLVTLKISLLGDCQIGKTSFVNYEKFSWCVKVKMLIPMMQTAIPILIGTKFDDFVRLPPDLQWTIVSQARVYARAMNATLFFSSATHNINVNKIFKFITAKLFNLPWTVERNLTIGEPIIDF